jgi:ABC-type nitrate/sulfonate/bicarbonate transport system ATPase subunit
MINLHDVIFAYQTKNILKNININIADNVFVSIVGKSGCGKTTLVNLIAGHLIPNSGEIIVNNKKVTKPGRDRIVINQENDLFDWLTVQDNLKLICDDNDLIKKYLDIADLYVHKSKYPKELSGGMKKKLSIIRAIISGGEIILMDEVFSSLDYSSKENLYKEILHIFNTTKKTMILVTHDIDEAMYLTDKVLVLKKDGDNLVQIDITKSSKTAEPWQGGSEYLKIKDKIKRELV